ncbi:hypothetical protein L3X38_039264 [Prunus dulcis]|uniref:Uncharacterized protein n=1 Tax=Prunus dulcis TaxID=3755 RepID=A0AAD4V828_PRUDU|nr:hypothetical protein L3X38_039264 [Prunus dulcis]
MRSRNNHHLFHYTVLPNHRSALLTDSTRSQAESYFTTYRGPQKPQAESKKSFLQYLRLDQDPSPSLSLLDDFTNDAIRLE